MDVGGGPTVGPGFGSADPGATGAAPPPLPIPAPVAPLQPTELADPLAPPPPPRRYTFDASPVPFANATSMPRTLAGSLKTPVVAAAATLTDGSPEPTDPTVAGPGPRRPAAAATGSASAAPVAWSSGCNRALDYWEQIEASGRQAGADPFALAALLVVEGSGERAVSPAGALGLMQLLPDKFQPGDNPFDVRTNVLRAAQHVAELQARWGSGDQVAAAYFGAIDRQGNVTGASDGNVNGFEYVRRFQAGVACVRSVLGLAGEVSTELLSPFGFAITPANITFGFLDDYGPGLAAYIRGAHGVQQYGTRHLAWDLIIPGAPDNGRGYPVFAPLAGRIVRTSDPVGGANGIWLENPALNLRARLMHMDDLAPGIVDGVQVRAGQWLGAVGAQGTEDFPHLHLALELLSVGARLDPGRFFFRPTARPLAAAPGNLSRPAPPVSPGDRFVPVRLPGLGQVRAARAWGSNLIWLVDRDDGPGLVGYDVDLGWTFQIGSPAASAPSQPAIGGETVVWLDRRNVVPDPAVGDLVDVYAYDLHTGQERRLTAAPGRYTQPVVRGRYAAWIDGTPQGLADIQLVDLQGGAPTSLPGSLGQPAELAISDQLLVWADRPPRATGPIGGTIRAYNLTSGELLSVDQGQASSPVASGGSVFWLEPAANAGGLLIQGRTLESGREWTIADNPVDRRNLQAADGELFWEQPSPDGSTELWLHGLSTGESRLLTTRPASDAGASFGRGGAVWSVAPDELAAAYLLDWDLPDGHFYAAPAGQNDGAARIGYSVTNRGGLPFWDEYRRLGGPAQLGRPLSGRVVLADGLTYLVTERALLQWRPDLGRAVLANGFDLLQSLGYDEQLHRDWRVPRSADPADLADANAADPAARLGWLTDPRIREHLLGGSPSAGLEQALARYGQPVSLPEDFGAFVAQRFQRAVLLSWRSGESWVPAPSDVAVVNVGVIYRALLLSDTDRQGDAPD